MDIFLPRALLISRDRELASGEASWSRPRESSGAKRSGGLEESEGEARLTDLVLVPHAFFFFFF